MLRIATLIAATSATAAMSSVSLARADTTQFLSDAQAAGFTDSSFGATGLEEAGTFVCAQLDQGQAPGDVAQSAIIAMPNLTPYQVGEFMGIAVNDLCPGHNAEVEQWANA